MTASQLTLSAPHASAGPPILLQTRSTRNNSPAQSSDAAGASDFGNQLLEHLASQQPAEPVPAHPEPTNAAGKLISSKQLAELRQSSVVLPKIAQPPLAAVKDPSSSKSVTLPAQALPLPNLGASTQFPAKDSSSALPSSGNKQRKVSQQDPADSGREIDSAELSSSAQQALSNLSSNDGQRGAETDTHDRPPATKAEENNPAEVSGAANTSNVLSGNLALAMRISSGNGDDANRQNHPVAAETGNAANVPAAQFGQSKLAPALESALQRHQPESPRPIETAAVQAPSGSSDSAKSGSTEESSKAAPAGFEAELNKALAEPVRAAHVQIAGSDNQRIDIRMLERGGALSVTVRSADSGLTKALQEHAPELTGRLSLENFRTELWAPGAAKNQSGRESSSGNPQSQGEGNSGQRNSGQQQKQNGRQSQTPEWVENFENDPTAFQKRIDYTWHR